MTQRTPTGPRSPGAALTGALAGLALVVAGAPRAARAADAASDKLACIAAAEDAQQQRIEGKLRAARDKLVACARRECPLQVRTDCSQWMGEVLAAMPTLVLGARDARGVDVPGVEVTLDGAVVAGALDGKPIEVDPGSHLLQFTSAQSAAPVEVRVVVLEGEKARPVTAVFGPAAVAGPPRAHAEPAPSGDHGLVDAAPATPGGPAAASSRGAVSPLTWALAGAGVVALGVGAYLELSTNADASSLSRSCGHDCTHDQVQPLVTRQQLFGPIAFGAGGVALGLATYLFFTRPADGGSGAHARVQWSVAPVARGAVAGAAVELR